MVFFTPLLVTTSLLFYLILMSFQLNSSLVNSGFIFDEVSLYMVYITCFVIYISFIFSLVSYSSMLTIVLSFMFLVCCLVFVTDSIFLLYLFYESSLIPILYIIINWGSYPERSVSSIILLLYTSFFTFPFVFVLFTILSSNGTLNFILFSVLHTNPSFLFSSIIFFTFAVKLPVYGLHFWLPIAHVEAPTFGSMVLAGVLLKLGGVGLIRFSSVLSIPLLNQFYVGYLFLFLSYVTIVCCLQSDFKRLVAYSSVSHIIGVPIMLFSSTFVGLKGILSLMFLHGISSPLMFILVGLVYGLTQTRQHLFIRGLIVSSPLIGLVLVLSFFFTLSAPPYPSFLSELFLAMTSLALWQMSYVFLVLFFFFSIVYNLLWLTSLGFLNQEFSYNYSWSFSYIHFIPIFMALCLMPIVFSILFFFIF